MARHTEGASHVPPGVRPCDAEEAAGTERCRAVRGVTVRGSRPSASRAAEPETVRLLRLGRDPFPYTLCVGVPAAPPLAPDLAELVRRARLGECAAVHRLCARVVRPAGRIVRRYLANAEREGTEELLFQSCHRAVEALQRTAEGDRTFDFEREVRIGVRLSAGGRVLHRRVTGGGRSAEETLLAYDVLASLPSHHADVLWAVDVEGEPAGRHPSGSLAAGRDALVDAYLWRGLRRTGPVEARGSHLSYLTAASYVRQELAIVRRTAARSHLTGCTLCRLLVTELGAPGTSLPWELTGASTPTTPARSNTPHWSRR